MKTLSLPAALLLLAFEIVNGQGAPGADQVSSPLARRVLDGDTAQLFDMTRDGQLVVGQRQVRVGTQEIVLRDLSTGEARVVAIGGGGVEISDDGTRVAFPTGGGLAVVGTGTPSTRVVVAAPPGAVIRPADWRPDGNAVLVALTYGPDAAAGRSGRVELAWVSPGDLSVRSIKTFEAWAAPNTHDTEPEVSPDGRFMAFVAAPYREGQDRFVYVMDAEGRTVEPVVSTSGQRGWPKWTPDGRHVVFIEERALGGVGLWSVPVANGRAAGQPRLLHRDLGSDSALLGVTAAGVLHYRRSVYFGSGRYAGNASHIMRRTRSGEAGPQPPITFRGCCSAWSPDSQQLVFARDGTVVVRDVETGQERSYTLPGVSAERPPSWFPDGSAVMVVGLDETYSGPGQSREGLHYYRIDIGTGAVRRMTTVGPLRSWQAAMSRDNRSLYMARRDKPDGAFTQIITVDVAAGTERRVASLPAGIALDPEIVVSPDGTTLAIGAIEGPEWESDGRIFTVKIDGTDFRDVGSGGIAGFWGGGPLRWTPDGRSLLIRTYDANRNWQIMRIPAGGGAVEFDGVSYVALAPLVPKVRMVPGNFNGFDVSPDDSRLVVSTLTQNQFEVWALEGLSWAP